MVLVWCSRLVIFLRDGHARFSPRWRVPFLCLPKETEPKERAPPAKLACGFSALLGVERACGTRFAHTVLGLIAQPLRYSTAWKGDETPEIGVLSGLVVWLKLKHQN